MKKLPTRLEKESYPFTGPETLLLNRSPQAPYTFYEPSGDSDLHIESTKKGDDLILDVEEKHYRIEFTDNKTSKS